MWKNLVLGFRVQLRCHSQREPSLGCNHPVWWCTLFPKQLHLETWCQCCWMDTLKTQNGKRVPISNVYHITKQSQPLCCHQIKLYVCLYSAFSFDVYTDANKVPFLTIASRFDVFWGKIDSPAHTSTRMGHNAKATLQNGCDHCHVCSVPKQLPVLQCIIFPEVLSLHNQMRTCTHKGFN